MKTRIRFLLLTALSTFIAITVLGAANAGAVQKRGGDRDGAKDRGRDRDQTVASQPSNQSKDSNQPKVNRGRDNRSNDRSRDNQATTVRENRSNDRSRDNRANNDRNRDRRGQDNRDINKDRDERLPYTGKIGNTIPVTPNPKSRDYRGSDRDRDNGRRNDSKFTRVQERPTYKPPVVRRDDRHYGNRNNNYRNRYNHWVFQYNPGHSHRSVYFYYGYFPYVPSTRVIIVNRPRVVYVEVPIVIDLSRDRYDDYYLDRSRFDSIEATIYDIRLAWIDRDADLLLRHVRSDTRIDVLLDGSYSYTVQGDDYRDMTSDAIETTDTISFQIDSVRKRGGDQVIAYGRHEFYDQDGDRTVAYVSYLLERRGGDWVITEVGSSLRRLDT